MLGWRDGIGWAGWLFSLCLACWHVVSAGSLWVGAALAAAGLAPHIWGASWRMLEGPGITRFEAPHTKN